jgi:hypothetical protein
VKLSRRIVTLVGREWETNISCVMGSQTQSVPPTEATETPVTKQADRQEISVDANNSVILVTLQNCMRKTLRSAGQSE